MRIGSRHFAHTLAILAVIAGPATAAEVSVNQLACDRSWLAQEWSGAAARCDDASQDYMRKALADYHAPAFLAAHGNGPPVTDTQKALGIVDFEVAAKMEARAAFAFYRLPHIEGVPAAQERLFAESRAANMLNDARGFAKQASDITATPSVTELQALLNDPAFFSLKPARLTALSI